MGSRGPQNSKMRFKISYIVPNYFLNSEILTFALQDDMFFTSVHYIKLYCIFKLLWIIDHNTQILLKWQNRTLIRNRSTEFVKFHTELIQKNCLTLLSAPYRTLKVNSADPYTQNFAS